MSFLPFFRAETNRFPDDPGAGPGDVPDIVLTFLAIDKNCSSQRASARCPGAGMQQPRAGAAARDAGAAAGAPPSGAPAASGCAAFAGGVVRPPAALRFRAVVPHRRTGRPQAACNMRVRVPAAARACVRAVRPRARASARHTHVSPTILSVLPAGSRPGGCALGRPPISCSLSLYCGARVSLHGGVFGGR